LSLEGTLAIRLDDLRGPEITAFIEDHVREMKDVTPSESKHALDLEGLKSPDIHFWSVWNDGALVGCGGLKALGGAQAEIKAMRTDPSCRGQGVASRLLEHIVAEASASGIHQLFLEIGSFPFFAPARVLYAKHGLTICEPFADYQADPNSVFMTRAI
jgi:putative acetyltransferase